MFGDGWIGSPLTLPPPSIQPSARHALDHSRHLSIHSTNRPSLQPTNQPTTQPNPPPPQPTKQPTRSNQHPTTQQHRGRGHASGPGARVGGPDRREEALFALSCLVLCFYSFNWGGGRGCWIDVRAPFNLSGVPLPASPAYLCVCACVSFLFVVCMRACVCVVAYMINPFPFPSTPTGDARAAGRRLLKTKQASKQTNAKSTLLSNNWCRPFPPFWVP